MLARYLLASRPRLARALAYAAATILFQLVLQRDALTRLRWWFLQRRLRRSLIEHDLVDAGAVRLVGGVDVSFVKESETEACAALVVLDVETLSVVHEVVHEVTLTAPYIPGYLAFREVGFLLELLDELRATAPHAMPGAILVDGNGILHPNRFGLACHLGVLAGLPTVGIGKSLHHVDGLTKASARRLAATCRARLEHAPLVGRSGAVWGALLRTSDPAAQPGGVAEATFKPVVVSIGHGLCLDSALSLVRRCCRHRIPEPIRQADLRSREWLRRRAQRGEGGRCALEC